MGEPDLSHLDAILAGLDPLASKQRGAPLRADDWNVVVDALRELTRITRARAGQSADALAANYAPIDHEHLGAVGLAWFDGPTRALVEGRGNNQAEFTVRDDLARLDKGVTGLRGEVGELRTELRGLRELVLQVRDEVLGGGRKLGKLELRVEALKDLELGVDRIGRDFAKLDGRLGEVLSLRDQIGEGEGKVDLAALGQRVGALELLRERLVGASPPPDLRVIQQDLVKLADQLAELGPGAPVELSDAGRAQLEALLDAELGATKTRLDALETKTAASESLLDQHATTLAGLPDYDAKLARIDQLEGQLDALGQHDEALTSSLGGLDAKLAGLDALLDSKLDSKLDSRLAGLELGGVDAELVAGLGARLDQLDASVEQRFASLGDLDARFASVAALAELGGSLTRLDDQARDRASVLDTLAGSVAEIGAGFDDLGSRLGTLEGGALTLGNWRTSVDGQLSALAQLGSGESEAALVLRVGDLEAGLATWNTWRTGASARLDTLEVGAVAANEARTSLAADLAGQAERLTKLDDRVGTLADASKTLGEWQLGVEGQLGTLASRVDEQTKLADRVGALEGLGLAGLGTRVTTVEGSLGGLDKTLSTTKTTLEGQGARLSAVEGSITTLDKQLATTSDSVATLSDSLALTTKTLDTLSTWKLGVDSQLGQLDGQTASLSEWQRTADKRLTTIDQSLGSLATLGTRVTSLESATKSLTSWQKQTDVAIGDLQIGAAKTTEIIKRVDTLDTQMLSLSDSNAKLLAAAKAQPIVQPTRLKPLG